MSSQIQGKLTYGEIKQQLLDAGFTEEWIQQNYPGGSIDMETLKEMYDIMQQQGAGIPQMNYTNLTGFLDNYIQNNTGEQYDQLRTYLSNQGYSDKEVNNIIRKTYGPSTIFDPLPGGVPDPKAGVGLQAIQFLTGTFDKFLGPQGSIRNFKANQKAFKASKPERTRYEVDIDPNDPNEYIFDPYDAAEGKLSTKAEYQDRLNEFSQFNYNPETGKYDAYYSARPLDEDTPGRTMSQIREGLSDRELQAFEGLNIMPQGSSFDITDGATIYYEPGEDERSQEDIDAATVNILERSNPKTSSDPSTIYFDPVYGKSDNSTRFTSAPFSPYAPSLTIDRLGGPVYQRGGSLPIAQKGEEKNQNLDEYDQTLQTNTPIILNTDFVTRPGGDSQILGIPLSETDAFYYEYDRSNPDNPKGAIKIPLDEYVEDGRPMGIADPTTDYTMLPTVVVKPDGNNYISLPYGVRKKNQKKTTELNLDEGAEGSERKEVYDPQGNFLGYDYKTDEAIAIEQIENNPDLKPAQKNRLIRRINEGALLKYDAPSGGRSYVFQNMSPDQEEFFIKEFYQDLDNDELRRRFPDQGIKFQAGADEEPVNEAQQRRDERARREYLDYWNKTFGWAENFKRDFGYPIAKGLTGLMAAPVIGPGALTAGRAVMGPVSTALNTPLISSLPYSTAGNALNLGFGADFVFNRAPKIPGLIQEGNYGEAALETGLGALDIAGMGAVAKSYKTGKNLLRNADDLSRSVTDGVNAMGANKGSTPSFFNDPLFQRFYLLDQYGGYLPTNVDEINRLDNLYAQTSDDVLRQMHSPETKLKLKNQGFTDQQVEDWITRRRQHFLDQISKLELVALNKAKARPSKKSVLAFADNDLSISGLRENYIKDRLIDNIPFFKQRKLDDARSLVRHELSHFEDFGGGLLTLPEVSLINSTVGKTPLERFTSSRFFPSKTLPGAAPYATARGNYFREPTEVRARLHALNQTIQGNPALSLKSFDRTNPLNLWNRFKYPKAAMQFDQLNYVMPKNKIYQLDKFISEAEPQQGMDALPMAQKGDETSADDNPLLPLSDEKMKAYEAGEITLSELISDDRNIKDMPYYQDRYDFTDNTQTFYNQEPTIDPFRQTSTYTNLPSEYEVIYKVLADLDPDDFEGGPPDPDDYRDSDGGIDGDEYRKDMEAYWDKYDDEYEKLMSTQDYKTLKVGAPEPFNPRIRYIDEAAHTESQLDEFYDQDLYDQYNYIRRIYSDLGNLNDRDNVGDSGTILSDYLFNIPVAPGTSKDDLGVKSYMLTGDKDITINDFLTVDPRVDEFTAEEKFFYPEYVNIPYSIDDIVSNPKYAAEYNLDVSNVTKDGRPYYTIVGLPESEGSFEDGSGVRSGKVAPVTVEIPRGGSKRLVASVPGSMDYFRDYNVFHDITMADLADPAEYSRRMGYDINYFNNPEDHAHSPYAGGFFGGARQDRSDFTLSNFGVANNYGGVGDPSFGMKYLPEADQYDVTTTEATLKPEIRQQLDELEAEHQKEYERRMALRDASAFYNKLYNTSGREQEVMPPGKSPHRRPQTVVVDREGNRLGAAGNTLYYYEDDEGNILYAADAGGWGSQKKDFGTAQDFLKNLDEANNTNLFTNEKGKLLTPKVISPMDNPRQYEEVFRKIYQFVDANIEEGSIQDPTLPLDQFVGPGIVRKDLMSTQQNDTDVKKYGGSILPMAQLGLTDDFDLTGGAEEIDLTDGSMFDNEGIFETEVQQPGTFNPYTLDYNPYADPVITEGKKQFGDRFLNFLQSPTAGLMGDIGSTAVGFARFMNPILNDIQAKRQEEELERFGMADNITPLNFSEFPTKGIQSTRSNLLGPESARYTYLNYGRRGTEVNNSREVEVDEETLLQLKKLGAEIEIL